jgi:hypothetical protein
MKGEQYVTGKRYLVLNSYILYKENYRGPGKLKSRYN